MQGALQFLRLLAAKVAKFDAIEISMLLRTKLHGKTYEFPDIRLLMGKANEEKSGDQLAGVAAETTAERVAAKLVLAEVPLWVLRENPAVPYDQDEVTRVIQDSVNETIYQEIKNWTVGELREWLLSNNTDGEMIRHISEGLTAEIIAAVTKLMSNLDLIYAASKIRITQHCNNTIGSPGTLSSRNQPNHPTDSPEGIRAGQDAGDRVPAFALPNARGRIVRSEDLLAKGHLLVSFYRGGW